MTRGGGTGANGPGALAGTIELASAAPGGAARASRPASPMAAATASTPSPATAPGSAAASLSLSGACARGRRLHSRRRARSAGPADRPSPYRQASLAAARGRAAVRRRSSCRPTSPPSPTSASAAPRSARSSTRGADASLRLVGRGRLPFAALAYVQVRDFSNGFAAVDAGRAAATPTLDQYTVPVDRPRRAASSCGRSPAPVELRLGADWRETDGRTQELFQFVAGAPTRGRVAGGRTAHARRLRRGGLDARRR